MIICVTTVCDGAKKFFGIDPKCERDDVSECGLTRGSKRKRKKETE